MDNFNLVKLDVGGEKCTTYYDTLKQSPYFQDLVVHKKAARAFVEAEGDDEVYFIDRDGDAFQDIMHYLRTYEIQAKDEERLKILRNEAKFYQFRDMVKKVDQMIVDCKKDNACYSVENLSVFSDTLDVGDSGQIQTFKDKSYIVAAYKHLKTVDGNEHQYKLVIKSHKEQTL